MVLRCPGPGRYSQVTEQALGLAPAREGGDILRGPPPPTIRKLHFLPKQHTFFFCHRRSSLGIPCPDFACFQKVKILVKISIKFKHLSQFLNKWPGKLWLTKQDGVIKTLNPPVTLHGNSGDGIRYPGMFRGTQGCSQANVQGEKPYILSLSWEIFVPPFFSLEKL